MIPFDKLVSLDKHEDIAESVRGLRETRIEYVFVVVRGATAEAAQQLISQVVEIAWVHKADLEFIGSFLVLTSGVFPLSKASPDGRRALVIDLVKQVGPNVKIVHGSANGHRGLLGSERVARYSFILPHFDEILVRLSRVQFGQCGEG